MINELFPDLLKLDGIEAIIIYNTDNVIVDSWARPHYNIKIFKELGLNFQQIFRVSKKTKQPFQEVVLNLEKGKIYSRFNSEILLIIVSKFKVEPSLIRLIVNVGLAKFEESRKVKKLLKKKPLRGYNCLKPALLDDVEEEYLNKIDNKKSEK